MNDREVMYSHNVNNCYELIAVFIPKWDFEMSFGTRWHIFVVIPQIVLSILWFFSRDNIGILIMFMFFIVVIIRSLIILIFKVGNIRKISAVTPAIKHPSTIHHLNIGIGRYKTYRLSPACPGHTSGNNWDLSCLCLAGLPITAKVDFYTSFPKRFGF